MTQTQMTANDWDPPQALAREQRVMSHLPLQNEMLMGWGPTSPEPAPGVYDFTGLDLRLALMRATGATPVITLCCAPDWMKGGEPGQTDWSNLTAAPLPQYYEAFAQLAVRVAKRYPYVRSFQVWNELKGFFDPAENRWDYEAYTAFYNTVYDALKAYDPTLQVGGPYVVFDSWAGPNRIRRRSTAVGERSINGHSMSSPTGSRTSTARISSRSTAVPHPEMRHRARMCSAPSTS